MNPLFPLLVLFLLIVVALVFEFINGFHDTANSIATVVGTKVLTPRQAIFLAASTNLCGALVGTKVAETIGKNLVDINYVTVNVLICALLGAIVWNLLTWWFGLPSSSTHALVGGLIGATVAAAQDNWHVIVWSKPVAGKPWYGWQGVWYKVVIPMFSSPILGFIGGFILMAILYFTLQSLLPRTINMVFGKLQLVSSGYMGFSHGSNDAQKTMGIVALALFTATTAGHFDQLPHWLDWLKTPKFSIAVWVKVICALTMAAGTAAGGWRIIRTMGHKMVRLQPIHGFAAETTSATVLMLAAQLGMPVSTTHAISTSIMGVGAAKTPKALRWELVERIIWTWFLTIPVTGAVAYIVVRLAKSTGLF